MPKIFLIKNRLQAQQAALLEDQKSGSTLITEDNESRTLDLRKDASYDEIKTLDLSKTGPRQCSQNFEDETLDLSITGKNRNRYEDKNFHRPSYDNSSTLPQYHQDEDIQPLSLTIKDKERGKTFL